jgi:carbamoyltransferase
MKTIHQTICYILLHVKDNKIQELGAITHVDNTCRAQTVNKNLNPQITTLLKKYKKLSGIPILMNTSFNDNGEPIVESPKDAILGIFKYGY